MVTVTKSKSESKSIVEVLEFCKVNNLPARVVGRWVWVKFESKPSTEVRASLKATEFLSIVRQTSDIRQVK